MARLREPLDESEEPILHSPRVVTSLLLAFIAVYVGMCFLSDAQYAKALADFALIPRQVATFGQGSFGDGLHLAGQFVTYAFLHSSLSHLVVNSAAFLLFGTAVARRIGTFRFLVLALVTTLGAACTHLWFFWGSDQPVVGASGVVSGLVGAATRFIFVNPHAQLTWPPTRLPLFSRPVILVSAVWIAMNIGLGLAGLTPQGLGEAVAWQAHIGGYLIGLLIFPLFDRQRSWIS